jgi:hypothetical protein
MQLEVLKAGARQRLAAGLGELTWGLEPTEPRSGVPSHPARPAEQTTATAFHDGCYLPNSGLSKPRAGQAAKPVSSARKASCHSRS